MSGPKPMSAKAFADKHSTRLNYKLIKILGERELIVACNDCGLYRTVRYSQGRAGPVCSCTHKRKFYRIKRTAETHTEELHELGYTDYTCVTFVGAKRKNVYQHKCGNKFRVSPDCLKGSKVPCGECRELGYSHEEACKIALSRGMQLLDEYKSGRRADGHLKVKHIKCGHINRVPRECVTTPYGVIRSCQTCRPTGIWYRGKFNGKPIIVRSKTEVRFMQYLKDSGVPLDKVRYEPNEYKVLYYNPIKKCMAKYTPDFAVGRTMVEVKDLASLGLANYNWMTKEEALIENRAKYEAAMRYFDDYRIYVLIKCKFHRVFKFWTKTEQVRIQNIH